MKWPRDYWKNIENAVDEAKQLMATHHLDNLPTSHVLRKMGYWSLDKAIISYHGGIVKFREVLGLTSPVKPPYYWKNIENVISEAKKCMADVNFEHLPGTSYLRKHGYSCLAYAISQYHGGMYKFRKILGQENPRRECRKWSDLQYTLEETLNFLKINQLTKLPSQRQIFQLRGSALLHAINSYHGGLNEFRKILGQQNLMRKPGTWKSLEFCLNYAKQVMIESGYTTLPSAKHIATRGHSALNHAIRRYHGGFHNFRRLLHEKSKRHKQGSLQSEAYVMKTVSEIMQTNNFKMLLSPQVLCSLGQDSLVNAIYKYHGGFRRFQALLMGKVPTEKEKMEYILQKYLE